MKFIKGARPIKSKEIKNYYDNFKYRDISLNEYTETWKYWILSSSLKKLIGFDKFVHSDYVNGTSQTFDHFVLKNSDKEILVIRGDFQYHSCISKFNKFKYIDYNQLKNISTINKNALIISAPFSDFGSIHYDFDNILKHCNKNNISVCLDLAYWGISKNLNINLNEYPCITEITFSLSKPFYVLENHRIGIRFTKKYEDDGINMLNEVNMQNTYSMSLGVYFMNKFGPDWNWDKYNYNYNLICNDNNLKKTNTVIFGLGDKELHSSFNRGVKDNYRVCISEYLGDIL